MTLVEIYRCLSDERRLRLLHLLAAAPSCVGQLQGILGLDQVSVSKQLAYLRERGFVEAHRLRHWMVYSLPGRRSLELDEQLRCLDECAAINKILRRDLERFKSREAECCSVPKVVLDQSAPSSGKAVRPYSTKADKGKLQLVSDHV